MASRGGPTRRVVTVPRNSLGGDWRIRDHIILPTPIIIPLQIIKLLFRHWRLTSLTLLALTLILKFHWPLVETTLLVIGIPLSLYLYRLLRLYRQHSTVPLKGVLRGFRYLLRFTRLWARAAELSKLGHPSSSSSNRTRGWRPPPIRSIEIANPKGTSLKVFLDVGHTGNTSDELERSSERILAVMDARTHSIQKIRPGFAAFTINWERRPSADLPLYMTSREQTPTPFLDLDSGRTGEALVDLGRSILIGGETGSGKSNDIWAMLARLNQSQIPKRLYVIDPVGGVELDELESSPDTQVYVDRSSQADQVVRMFKQDMDTRLAWMKQNKIRRHVPTPDKPICILIIDEIIVCKEMLKGGALSPLGDVIATGRKAGFVVWACTQLAQKEVITHIRDLFPQRIAHRTRTAELTDCILGTRATDDGAVAHRLIHPGDGYVYTDELKAFVQFHAPHIIHTRSVAQGGVPLEPTPITRRPSRYSRATRSGRPLDPHSNRSDHSNRDGVTFVYQLFDSDTSLQPCYVGIASNPNRRFQQHSKDKVWFHTIIHQRSILTPYPSRSEAKQEETRLITRLNPKYNVQERDDWKD